MCSILTQSNLFICLQIWLIQILQVFSQGTLFQEYICLLFPVDIDQTVLKSVQDFSMIFGVLLSALHQFLFSQVILILFGAWL